MSMAQRLSGVLPDSVARPASVDDAPLIGDLMRRVSKAATGTADATDVEVADELTGSTVDLSLDSVVVVDDAGVARLYGQAFHDSDERFFLDVFVDPCWDGDQFNRLAQRGVRAGLERLEQILRELERTSVVVAAGLYRQESQMAEVYQAHGFRTATVFWRMQIDLGEPSPTAAAAPRSVQIVAVDPDDDTVMAAALDLRNHAFQEHHGHVDLGFAAYSDRWRGASSYDRRAWWFALSDGEVIGICLGDESKASEGGGFIRSLAVSRPARGRGIARALLRTAFDEYRGRSRAFVQLGVDTGNTTGATRLYESVGMRVVSTIDVFERPLRLAEPS